MNAMVSVIIPLYNKAETIAETLESVLSQSYQNLEVIVVDDGSTDSGPNTVRCVRDPRLRFFSQKNAGPGAARNFGVSVATGSFLCFLDADDQFDRRFLEMHLTWLNDHQDCQMSVCGYVQGSNRVDNMGFFEEIGMLSGEWTLVDEPRKLRSVYLLAGWICSSGAIVCRRTSFEKVGGFYSANRCVYGEDHSLWLAFLLNYKVYLNSMPLMWINTEASSLGVALSGRNPPRPILTDAQWILRRVPNKYKGLVEKLRSKYAVLYARQCVDQRSYMNAIHYLLIPMARGDFLGAVVKELVRMVYMQMVSSSHRLGR